MRKPIQITAGGAGELFVLCDDGTIHMQAPADSRCASSHWQKLAPIPDDDMKRYQLFKGTKPEHSSPIAAEAMMEYIYGHEKFKDDMAKWPREITPKGYWVQEWIINLETKKKEEGVKLAVAEAMEMFAP